MSNARTERTARTIAKQNVTATLVTTWYTDGTCEIRLNAFRSVGLTGW